MYKKFIFDLQRKETDLELLESLIAVEKDQEKRRKLILERDNLLSSLNYREKLNYGI